MSDFTIRPASEADIPAITAIYGHSVANETASFEFDPPSETEMTRRMAVIRDSGYPYFVCENNKKRVIGYAYASSYRPRIGYNHTVEDSVYIAPDFQRQGAGRALLSALIAECEALGFRQMVAVVGDSRLTGSIALHRGLGFEIVARMPNLGHKFGLWLDSILMQRALGPGAAAPPARPGR